MLRASGEVRGLFARVDQDRPNATAPHPRGAKAVIDQRTAALLSAVVRDGEFPEHAAVAKGGRAPEKPHPAAAQGRIAPVTAGVAALACLWAGARANHDFGNTVAHAAAAGGSFGAPTAAAGPMFGASRDPGEAGGDPAMTPKNSARVAAMAVAAAVTANGALAGDAVQWRVEDGGNGHWYALKARGGTTWSQLNQLTLANGGHLATMTGAAERDFLVTLMAGNSCAIGGFQTVTGAQDEPAIGWGWCTGEATSWTNWAGGEPNNTDLYGAPSEDAMGCRSDGRWVDLADHLFWTQYYLSEWDADCNSDGIVDYGQCRNGTLPDYNVNNVPDCCEQGAPCLPGRYPLQWRSEDGGNGHWYQASASLGLTFLDARARAKVVGGDLVTPQSPAELDFVFRKLASDPAMWWHANGIPRHGPWIGLRQDRGRPDYSEPAGGWTWIDGTDATFQNWDFDTCRTQPTDCFCVGGCGLDNAGFYEGDPASGNTVPTWGAFAADMSGRVGGVIIEWSADCNADGIVDYGQILAGALADANSNGVPDTCECATNPSLPSCCPGDIYRNGRVDGADLGALLSEWGPVTPLTNSDLDGNGQVNGADLGILLAHWGPCGG
jgi:hypothetical protein